MSEVQPGQKWLKLTGTDAPFFCGNCGLQNEVRLHMYSFQIQGNDVFDTYICKEEGCENKIIVHTIIKRDPVIEKPKSKKQKRLPI